MDNNTYKRFKKELEPILASRPTKFLRQVASNGGNHTIKAWNVAAPGTEVVNPLSKQRFTKTTENEHAYLISSILNCHQACLKFVIGTNYYKVSEQKDFIFANVIDNWNYANALGNAYDTHTNAHDNHVHAPSTTAEDTINDEYSPRLVEIASKKLKDVLDETMCGMCGDGCIDTGLDMVGEKRIRIKLPSNTDPEDSLHEASFFTSKFTDEEQKTILRFREASQITAREILGGFLVNPDNYNFADDYIVVSHDSFATVSFAMYCRVFMKSNNLTNISNISSDSPRKG